MRICASSRRRPARGSLVVLSLLVALCLAGQTGIASAQTQFFPYYGKNNIHYDNFDWHVYTTDHFEIYYYPEIERHLERVAGYAESAYQHISADLKHDLSFKIQLILFKTHSEFEQQNVAQGAAQEGVAAFAEPYRNRMLLPIDDPPDNLYGLITHELTHQFQFDIIPQGLIRQNVPLWVNEGGAEFERGQWDPLDLMMVRDAAVADIVPKMSQTEGYGNANNARLVPYNLGHAVYEFIDAKFGAEGVRQFLFALRKSVIGGGEDAYEEALHMKPDEFDQAFERYIKERFKPFRDKERPADYGRDLAPNQEKTHYAEGFSIAPSPSGDLMSVATVNRKDGEIDLLLVSSKDGSIVRNLTNGFDKDFHFDHIVQPTSFITVPWMAWSPKGDRLAYLVRTEKERTLILQNILTGKIEERVPMKSVDEPESPSFSPDGRTIVVSAMRGGTRDIYTVDLESREMVNLTTDDFFDYSPVYSPDGKYLVYKSRISGNQKLFRLDLDTKKKTQLTFGTNDETAAQFYDDHTLVFSSTATDPNVPLDPETAKNGNIYNIWTLDLNNGELKQYTDAVSGVLSPIVLSDPAGPKIAFVTYYKGDYGIHILDRKEPLHTAASSDFGAPGPIIDFQAPLSHTLVTSNIRQKKAFEKMFLEGRPPISVGVTNNGDVFGGTEISFGDVLGDKQVNLFASSIAQYRTFSLSYVNIGRRFQYALQGYSQTQFFYGQLEGLFYDPSLAGLIGRDQAVATRSVRGGTAFGIYPIDRFRRIEFSAGLIQLNERYNDPQLEQDAADYQEQNFGQQIFRNGTVVPFSVAFVQETTVFREFGPLAGSTMRLSYDVAPKLGPTLSRQTVDGDVRYYQRLASNGVLALRFRGYKSYGDYPDFLYFGGNSEMRGYDYLQFVGQNAFFANAELRFPIIEAALTPVGVVGGVRGVFFANIGGGWFNGQNYKFATSKTQISKPFLGNKTDASHQELIDPATGLPIPEYGPEQTVSGFRLQDGRASYGLGLETFALGFPIHFDWSWRTLFNKDWEDVEFAADGGSSWFRKPRFAVWIGYDF
jgi:Tol biopolymer transport system component